MSDENYSIHDILVNVLVPKPEDVGYTSYKEMAKEIIKKRS